MSDRRRRRGLVAASALAFAAVAAGCAATMDPPAPLAQPGPVAPPLPTDGADRSNAPGASTTSPLRGGALDDALIATVGGRPILASELLAGLRQRDARLLNFHINLLVGERLAELAAEALGVVLDEDLVDARARAAEAAFVAQLEGADLEAVLREELGVDPAAFRRRLGDDARRELLTERVVRAWTLGQEWARVRILVAAPQTVAEAQQRFAAGEGFAGLASELSRDPTGADGGLVPFVVRSERSRLSRLAFRTDAGALGGPFELDDEGLEILLFVESRNAPLTGTWADVRGTVEASLASHPVSEEEYVQWQVALESATLVDLAPISRLLGEELR